MASNGKGRIESIHVFPSRRGPATDVRSAIARGKGLEGDHPRSGKRHVSVLSLEQWNDALRECGGDLHPRSRRANVVVSGVDLRRTEGATLKLGAVTLRITMETDPCDRMDEVQPGLRAALGPEWRGGVLGTIVAEGSLAIGDEVELIPAPRAPD